MVGSVTRWEPGVGRDQQHLAVTDHVAGLDPPIIPLSLPTLSRPLPSHAHTPRPAEDPDGSVEETPCLEEHRRGRERTTSPCHAPLQPPASVRPESLPGLDAPANGRQHNHHRAPAPTTSSALEVHPGTAAHTSTNGTRKRPPPILPPALATPDTWAEPEETAPLTPATNGEVARRGLNGVVVKKMAPVEEAVIEEEVEEEEETALRHEEEVEEEEELKCGLGPCCTPVWLQKYASKQMFLFVFCLTSVLQGMYYTYVVSILTTIEKLFQLQSKTTGIILSATEMGQIGGALLLTYYGGQGHRPKWIGWGIILFAFFAFFSSLPHFLFGDTILKRFQDSTPSQDNPLESANTCEVPGWSAPELNASLAAAGNATNDSCDSPDSLSQVVMSILFLSLLGVGIGQTAAYNLGIPYIDDNIASRESPIYFAVTSGVRILGPTLGFVLGSFCTRLYVDPFQDPSITPNDPRWIGAWWLGLVVVSVALFLTSLAMFSFPHRLPFSPAQASPAHQQALNPSHPTAPPCNPSLRDFPRAVRRLLGNDILMLRMASSVLHILPISGLYTFLPKYLESQFRLPVHSAAMVSGMGGIMVMGVGIFTSGIFIRRAKPSARAVSGWIALTALVYSLGMVILMFVGCPVEDFVGLENGPDGKHFVEVCNRTCGNCDDSAFAPVCGTNARTYFSACHLGCSNVTNFKEENKLVFSDCECLPEGETAVLRLCELDCSNFTWYVIIFSIFVLIHSTSEVGGMLVTLRCVDPKDKAMALGLISGAIGLFGNVPCPIIYGAVVDYACIHWQETCEEPGACQLYDTDIFRMFFHGITGSVMMLAFIVDAVVWYRAKSVSFTDMDDTFEEATSMSHKSVSRSPSTAMITIQSPTTSTAQDVSPKLSPSEGEPSVSHEDQPVSSV